jgi:hypothetical protein
VLIRWLDPSPLPLARFRSFAAIAPAALWSLDFLSVQLR